MEQCSQNPLGYIRVEDSLIDYELPERKVPNFRFKAPVLNSIVASLAPSKCNTHSPPPSSPPPSFSPAQQYMSSPLLSNSTSPNFNTSTLPTLSASDLKSFPPTKRRKNVESFPRESFMANFPRRESTRVFPLSIKGASEKLSLSFQDNTMIRESKDGRGILEISRSMGPRRRRERRKRKLCSCCREWSRLTPRVAMIR